MSEPNDRPESDLLERATAALRNVQVPQGPPPQLAASTVEALKTTDSPPDIIRFSERKHRMFRFLRYGTAAAATLLAVVAGALWLIDRNAAFSFAQVVDKVQKAKTVSFTVQQQIGNQPRVETKMAIRGDTVRMEMCFGSPDPLQIMIVDTDQRKGLQLDALRKVATKIDLEGAIPAEDLKSPIDRLRNLKEDSKDNVVQYADEMVDGRTCHVFEVKGRGKATILVPDQFKLWVDAKTELPVKIQAQDQKLAVTYGNFKWDEPLEEDLFSLNLPKGYRLEELTPAVIKPGRIYYQQGWVELRSLQPDGQKAEIQFVPRFANSPIVYCSEKAELSPDGRYLAIAYTHVTDKGSFPPNRVLLWDRTQPKEPAVEVYVREEGELQSWQFSPDGQRLYVNFWEQVPGQPAAEGRYGTEIVDLATKAKQDAKLPTFKDADGKEMAMFFAAASADGQTYLVVGGGLHVATADGKVVRRLSAADMPVIVPSVRLSPDGKQVVYATYRAADRSQQLFVVPLAGGEPKALVSASKFTDLRPRWSPDGKRIAFTSRLLDTNSPPHNYGTETSLQLVDPNGANEISLMKEKVHPQGASLELTAWR